MRAFAIMLLTLLPGWAGVWAAEGEPAAPAAPATRPMPQGLTSGHFLETLVGLAVVLLLIFAIAFVLRRFGRIPGVAKGAVQVLGGVSVGSRERAVLISVEGQRLLLGVAPGRVQTLYVLPGQHQEPGFEQQLTAARQGNEA